MGKTKHRHHDGRQRLPFGIDVKRLSKKKGGKRAERRKKRKKKEKRWCSQLPQLQQKTVVLSVCISFLFPPLTLSVGKLEKSSPPWRRASSLPYSSVVFGWGSVLSLLYTFDRLAMAASAVPPQPARASRTGLFCFFSKFFLFSKIESRRKNFSKKKFLEKFLSKHFRNSKKVLNLKNIFQKRVVGPHGVINKK